jgi:hypothetical protein
MKDNEKISIFVNSLLFLTINQWKNKHNFVYFISIQLKFVERFLYFILGSSLCNYNSIFERPYKKTNRVIYGFIIKTKLVCCLILIRFCSCKIFKTKITNNLLDHIFVKWINLVPGAYRGTRSRGA